MINPELRLLLAKVKSQQERWKRISNQTVEEIIAYLDAQLTHNPTKKPNSAIDCALLSALQQHKERILELEKELTNEKARQRT